MGTRLTLEVQAAERPRAMAAAEAALAEIERQEALLSTWDPQSPLSRLNAAPVGVAAHAPPELMALLEEAESWASATGRAFEPAVGALVDAWDLRGAGALPSDERLAVALRATGPAAVELDVPRSSIVRREGAAWIDTGGFGKGAALRSAANILRGSGVTGALMDLGGQVLVSGDGPAPGGRWRVDVAHPGCRERAAARLLVADAAVATSGLSERWVEVDGRRLGHVLDPRTGRPAPAWGSVTVVSADALAADAISTALYVMGPDEGMAWARDREDVGVLFLVEEDGAVRARWNEAMEKWLADAPAEAPEPIEPEKRGTECLR